MGGTSVLTGAAGEHFVLSQLHRKGLLAAQSPSGAYAADIFVFSPEMGVGSMIQVKTRTYGADGGWHMSKKHETLVHPRLFYTFVDFEPTPPAVYVVPSSVVADIVTKSHRVWLTLPGRGGRPHKNTKFRRLLPMYPYEVPGYSERWIDEFRERWDLLTEDPRLED